MDGTDSDRERHGGLRIGRPELREKRIGLGDTHRHFELTVTSVTIARDVGI
jgi:hypothetical protein